MLKRIILYTLLFLILFSACSRNQIPENGNPSVEATKIKENPNNAEIKFSLGAFNENDIQQLFTMNRDEIEKYLGTDYVKDATGTEGEITYQYLKHDITIEYGLDNKILFINCGNQVTIFNTNSTMLFDEIRSKLGDANIEKWSPEEDQDIVIYKLTYDKGNLRIMYISENENGEDATLRVIRIE